jgi:epoxyqueuosine reductase
MHPASCWTPELEALIHTEAQAVGFHLSAVATAEPSSADSARFAEWIAAGRAGEMEYLKRRDATGDLLRSSLRTAIPWAQSILICALNYNADAPRSLDPAPADTGWIARYAWSGKRSGEQNPSAAPATATEPPAGQGSAAPTAQRPVQEAEQGATPAPLIPTDYHDELLSRLRQLEAHLHAHADCETRCYVDTGPIVERAFAARAGIGWIGKNTCVINQNLGSFLLLGVIVTSLPLARQATLPAADRCGSCTRCIDACPTDALIAPRQMDASRCIAYLTIEKKGSIPAELRPGLGRQVFGCDICQDVCPWNRKAPVAVTTGMEPRTELVNPALDLLAQLDSAAFKRRFKGSPLERTGRKRLHRNTAIAMGNSGETRFLPQLEAWAAQTEDPVLAETAQWAIARLQSTADPARPR